MKSARINFGLPRSEYVAEVNDQGEAISFRNQDTDTEYIGGGGGEALLTYEKIESRTYRFNKTFAEIKEMIDDNIIPFFNINSDLQEDGVTANAPGLIAPLTLHNTDIYVYVNMTEMSASTLNGFPLGMEIEDDENSPAILLID